jgi:hypothetical protein
MLYPASQEARRALELIAAHPDGCTEAVLAAENISADALIELPFFLVDAFASCD